MPKRHFEYEIGYADKTDEFPLDQCVIIVRISENIRRTREMLAHLVQLKHAMQAQGYKVLAFEDWLADPDGDRVLRPMDGDDIRLGMSFVIPGMTLDRVLFARDVERILNHTFVTPELRVS